MVSGLIDLHVHTTASDGTMTPAEAVFYAARRGLKAIAITDHDTVSGVCEAVKAAPQAGIEVVPGVEIGVDYPGEMHILGYYVDPENPALLEGLAELRSYRDNRNPQMAEKLCGLGFDITLEEVARAAKGGVIGRPHFAAVLKEKGYIKDIGEAFERYIGAGKPAYVKKDRLSPCQGIGLIKAAGGIPVLAHPKYLQTNGKKGLDNLLEELIGDGLMGIEAYYTHHTSEDTGMYTGLAGSKGLLVTGGSDFHGANKADTQIGIGKGNLRISYNLLESLKQKHKSI